MEGPKDACLSFFNNYFEKIYAQDIKEISGDLCTQIGACPAKSLESIESIDEDVYVLFITNYVVECFF